MKSAVELCLKRLNINNCIVCIHDGLLVDFLKENGIKYMVRGLRSVTDYEYEENMAGINTMLCSDIEYVYLRSDNNLLSSSMVRELTEFGRDISQFVPKEILAAYEERK